jgi:phosphopantothenoylcysteine decarboxylase/phosphopantothenate--cysteine ligase
MTLLRDANVVLAVSGGIAAYKAADLASKLVQAGATVETILSRSAQEFVKPLTFSALTRRPVHADPFEAWTEAAAGHITLAHDADVLLIAPATANTIARLALGLADDLLGMVSLATTAPLTIAPAMEHQMYLHPATQGHIATLRARGATIVGPDSGRLASGEIGTGRFAPTEDILGALRIVLGRNGVLAGQRVVVTAGGTHEPLDPVRFLGNRSSGKMGYALAQAALDRGASVTLISGPTNLRPPYGAKLVNTHTARDMEAAVHAAVPEATMLVMSAAVSDFRPRNQFESKLKKEKVGGDLTIELDRNPDIVAGVSGEGLFKIGFAAETDDLLANATDKLRTKGLDMIVANDAVATIGSDESTASLLFRDGGQEPLAALPKEEVAGIILDRAAQVLAGIRTRSDAP